MCKIGIQLYAVRNPYWDDVSGTLSALSAMGYSEVEGFGGYTCSAAELDKMLKDNGLSMCGWHTGLDCLTKDKYLDTLEYHERIGNKILGINAGADMLNTDDKIKWLRDAMHEAQALIAPYGFTLEYHNHWWEFEDKNRPYDKLAADADFALQFDIGNALKGGVRALDLLSKYNGRCIAVHCKPYSFEKGFDCSIGDRYDSVEWRSIVPELKKQGIEHFTIECEGTVDQLELARKNIEGLKKFIV